MGRRTSVVHAVLLLAAVVLPLVAAQPWPTCGTSGTYEKGSVYESNLLNLALTLHDGASSSPILFSTGSIGTAPNTVYGLLQCRGDVSPAVCADCGTNVWRGMGLICHRAKDVALVYNECYARLSDKDDFLTSKEGPGQVTLLVRGTNITNTDVTGYDCAVTSTEPQPNFRVQARTHSKVYGDLPHTPSDGT
ncbi:hypothetical protein E2562_001002 [Oryza meyeriana var. granulata]|uniref:Gnk2-homologous domain-containing protein n=1 Tax=Oryza meyeriana var. granulata TaxID=110450 RepID=A0A6G1D0F2_9ORYZ|nr:hypothetical protein E2562_001002 [Oryza meyeriana var. granulata]